MNTLGRYRPSPSMIVAIIALVVATTGGAVAAVLVTGANIKNGSVTGLDIKDNSLRGVDVKAGSLETSDLSNAAAANLRGRQGPAGPAGAAGPAGPSAAYHFDSGAEVLGWDNQDKVVATLNLPAGNYALFGKVLAGNDSGDNTAIPASISCAMALGGSVIDSSPARNVGPGDSAAMVRGDREQITLSGRGALTAPGAVTITCTSGQLGGFEDRHIEAIQVGSLP